MDGTRPDDRGASSPERWGGDKVWEGGVVWTGGWKGVKNRRRRGPWRKFSPGAFGQGELLGKGVFSLALVAGRHAMAPGFQGKGCHPLSSWAQVRGAAGLPGACTCAGGGATGQGWGQHVEDACEKPLRDVEEPPGSCVCAQGSASRRGVTHR